MVRSPLYPRFVFALRVVLGLALAWLVVTGDLISAVILAVFLGLSFAYLLRDDSRPTVFDVLFLLAAVVGAFGYVFDLFSEVVPYDELTHAFATFSVSLAFLFLFYQDVVPRRRAIAVMTSVFTLGMTVGALWEIFEWVTGNRYGLADTISDLVMDGIGALIAAAVALGIRSRRGRLT